MDDLNTKDPDELKAVLERRIKNTQRTITRLKKELKVTDGRPVSDAINEDLCTAYAERSIYQDALNAIGNNIDIILGEIYNLR